MTEHSAEAKRGRRQARVWTALGLGSLLWFLLRTGAKPQRATYPCQQAALASGLGFLSYLAALAGALGLRRLLRRHLGAAAAAAIAALLLAVISIGHPGGATPARAAAAGLPGWTSATAVSDVFVAEAVPAPECSLDGGVLPATAPCSDPAYAFHDKGVERLVRLMETHGTYLHTTAAHPAGLIGASDVVVIKINNQWGGVGEAPSYGRLSTNSDVLKGVIWRILQHPDGFSGEIVVAENTQWANQNWDNNPANAQDQDQSYQDVVAAFQAHGYPVSFAAWDDLPLVAGSSIAGPGYPIGEYARGNSADAYVLLDDPAAAGANQFSYPKFRTSGGRYVSMRYGLWNGTSYEPGRLKLVNLPVLKKHCMAGSTIAWKNLIGFVTIADDSVRFGNWDAMHDFFWGYTGGSAPSYGLVGREIALVREPVLNIVDAIWVATEANYYGAVARQDALVASTDPFAADWYTSEYVLRPVVPDEPNDSSAARAGIFRRATRVNQTAAQATWPGSYPYIQMLDSCDSAVACAAEKSQMNAYVSAADLPTLSISNRSVSEGNAGTGTAEFTVTLSAPATGTVTAAWATADGTATAGSDYTAASGTVTFSAGTTTQPIAIAVAGDLLDENDEQFFVNLSSASGATIADGQGLGTIVDDDSSPSLSVSDATATTEGDCGTTDATFTVALSPASARTVTVAYATADGTTQAGLDYQAASGVLTFPAGTTSRNVTVPVLGDPIVEGDESYTLGIGQAVNAVIADGQGVGTIVDDDAVGSGELAHGAERSGTLTALPGPVAREAAFVLAARPLSSYEVLAEGRGDVQPLVLEKVTCQGNVTSAEPVGTGPVQTLRWENAGTDVAYERLRVRGECAATCGADAGYSIRALETTLTLARFNNSATQVSVLLIQNPTAATVAGHVYFWSPAGALLATLPISLAPMATLVSNTSGLPALAGKSGSGTIAHDGGYGALVGKAVALEPSTGFSFDTPLLPRPR